MSLMHVKYVDQSSSRRLPNALRKQGGFTLLEILISIVILALSMLGALSMQANGLTKNQSAFLRTQAANLAADMAHRIRSNRTAAINNAYNSINTNSLTVSSGENSCVTNAAGCSPADLASADINEWSKHFRGVPTEGYKPIFPGGTGVVSGDGETFTITITWSETDWKLLTDTALGNKAASTKTYVMDFKI
jgi:type IV pilus assembly protein PilV